MPATKDAALRIMLILSLAPAVATASVPAMTNAPATKPPAAGGQPTVVKSVIPPEVVGAAGLTKLTAEEMATLNRWLDGYMDAVAQKAMRTALEANPSMPSPQAQDHASPLDVIESRIEGDFDGWNGETTVRLANGQTWQQTSYALSTGHAFSPAVIIFRQMGRYRMKVEGVPGTVMVRQVK